MQGRHSVEPHLKTALKNRNHELDNLFTKETLDMKKKPKKGSSEDVDEDGYVTVERTGVNIIFNVGFGEGYMFRF